MKASVKQQVRRPNRYSIYIDGKYTLSLGQDALLNSGLYDGKELSRTELTELKKLAATDKAYASALNLVSIRPRSEGELHDYFARKSVDKTTASQVVARLRNAGLVNDLDFARAWVNNRRQLKNASTRRLQMELRQKHVPDDIISQVLEDNKTEDDRQSLKNLIAKKQSRYPDRQKFMQYLARQGFAYSDIQSALGQDS